MKKYIEIDKKLLKEVYGGNVKAALRAGEGIAFDTAEKIRHALAYFENPETFTEKDAEKAYRKHMELNKKNSVFVEF